MLGADLAALAGLVLAWWGASGEADVAQQGGWLALATAVVAASVLVNATGFAVVRQCLRRTTRTWAERAQRCLPGPAEPARPGPSHGWLSVEGRTRYLHRPECPLVAGKAVRSLPVESEPRNGDEPCGVCGG
ncbi:MAG: hypothetical protein ACRD0O_12315 [Acidimicrobiia bacterium]